MPFFLQGSNDRIQGGPFQAEKMRFSLALAHHTDADDLAAVLLNDPGGLFKGLGPVGQTKVETGT